MDEQIAAARDRVLDDFAWPHRPADEVNAAFDLELKRFENASIQSFVSILVERAVRAAFADDGVPTPRRAPCGGFSQTREARGGDGISGGVDASPSARGAGYLRELITEPSAEAR